MPEQPLIVKLPDGSEISVEKLDLPFGELVDRCRAILQDPQVTKENFGAVKHFFFVDRSRGALIDDDGFFFEAFTLDKMGLGPGHILELCYVPK